MIGKSVGFNSVLLGCFALCTAGVVALTFEATIEKIDAAKLRVAKAALSEIIPANQHDNDLFTDTIVVDKELIGLLGLNDEAENLIHVARKNGEPTAVIIPTMAKDGYSGNIKMIMGVDQSGSIIGVRVTEHNETPGLGDYIDIKKGNWILSFNGKHSESDFEQQNEINPATGEAFDQLTGATITRKAVTRQVQSTLNYFQSAQPLQSANMQNDRISE